MRVIYHSKIIWTIEDFLTTRECDDLILFSEQTGFEEAKVSLSGGAKMIKGIRNNFRIIYNDEKLANNYWKKLKDICPDKIEDTEALGLNEQFSFLQK